jgi:hypothetical protein
VRRTRRLFPPREERWGIAPWVRGERRRPLHPACASRLSLSPSTRSTARLPFEGAASREAAKARRRAGHLVARRTFSRKEPTPSSLSGLDQPDIIRDSCMCADSGEESAKLGRVSSVHSGGCTLDPDPRGGCDTMRRRSDRPMSTPNVVGDIVISGRGKPGSQMSHHRRNHAAADGG